MLRLIGRHWRGDTMFWLSLLVYSIALPVFLFWGMWMLSFALPLLPADISVGVFRKPICVRLKAKTHEPMRAPADVS